jgi:hypothetical protein
MLYPTLPNWRMCVLCLVAGVSLGWLWQNDLLLLVVGGLLVLSGLIVAMFATFCFVAGKAD